MKEGIGGKLILLFVGLLAPIMMISSCVPSKQEKDIRGELANELWETLLSKEPREGVIGVAKGKEGFVAFKDKSLGKPLNKPPVLTGG